MGIMLENVDGIIFDMDGVIFDTEQIGLKCWRMLAEKYGLGDITATAMKCIGRSTVDTMKIFDDAYGDKISVEKLYTEAKIICDEILERDGMPLKKGAHELLELLKWRGVKTGLASSTSYEKVVRQLKMAKLYDYFQVIVGGDMVEHSKPEPDIYLLACEKLGVRPENTLAVEDSKNGIISAYRAGMISLLVPDLIKPDSEILKMAYSEYSSLSEVMDCLE